MRDTFTILLGDDDPQDAELMRLALKDCGLPVRLYLAKSADQVLDYFAKPAPFQAANPFPDLVILDLKQPLLNGLEVLTWLRSHRAWDKLPVVILSASPLNRDVDDAYHCGANTFFTKPGTHAELCELVALLVFYWSSSLRSVMPNQSVTPNRRFWIGDARAENLEPTKTKSI